MIKVKGIPEISEENDFRVFLQKAIDQDEDLLFENILFKINQVDGYNALEGVKFKSCSFQDGIQVSNLSPNGSFLVIEKCSFSDYVGILLQDIPSSYITISNNCSCHSERKSKFSELTSYPLIRDDTVFLNRCTTGKLYIGQSHCDTRVENSMIYGKFTVAGGGDDLEKTDRLELQNCKIGPIELLVKAQNGSNIYIQDCQDHHDIKKYSEIYSQVFFLESNLKSLNITNSSCPNVDFYLNNISLETINIEESSIGDLNLTMSETFPDSDRKVYKANFHNATVMDLFFIGRVYNFPFDFSSTTFTGIPFFYGHKIHQGTLFPPLENFRKRSSLAAEKAYRALRLAMEEHRAREEEGLFYILENETKLNNINTKTKYFSLAFWYKISSNFGTNYIKPLCLMILFFLIFTVLYAFYLSPVLGLQYNLDWLVIERALYFSLNQMIFPFYSFKDLGAIGLDNTTPHLLLRCIAAFQSFLSVSLFTLAIIAIRWKFKRS